MIISEEDEFFFGHLKNFMECLIEKMKPKTRRGGLNVNCAEFGDYFKHCFEFFCDEDGTFQPKSLRRVIFFISFGSLCSSYRL